jgi:hypothetical protein
VAIIRPNIPKRRRLFIFAYIRRNVTENKSRGVAMISTGIKKSPTAIRTHDKTFLPLDMQINTGMPKRSLAPVTDDF